MLMRTDKRICADKFFDIILDVPYKEFLNHHITRILVFYVHRENGGTLEMVVLISNSIYNLGGYLLGVYLHIYIHIYILFYRSSWGMQMISANAANANDRS